MHLVIGLRRGMHIFVNTLSGKHITLDAGAFHTTGIARRKRKTKIEHRQTNNVLALRETCLKTFVPVRAKLPAALNVGTT